MNEQEREAIRISFENGKNEVINLIKEKYNLEISIAETFFMIATYEQRENAEQLIEKTESQLSHMREYKKAIESRLDFVLNDD